MPNSRGNKSAANFGTSAYGSSRNLVGKYSVTETMTHDDGGEIGSGCGGEVGGKVGS